jgi:integrase
VISLYTGVRPSELAQVTVNNIRREGEILIMRIEGKLKTRNSWRTIPVHSKLIDLGFETRVDQLRGAGQTHLFPAWYSAGMSAYQRLEAKAAASGKPVSRNTMFPKFVPTKFKRSLKRIGVTDERLDFYSLRHTFRTKLINAGVIKDLADRLTGHSDHSASSSYDHSGGNEERTLIEHLHHAIEKLHFEGMALAQVKVPQGQR